MTWEPPSRGLRASDADREAVVERLHAAASEGRLDAEELEARLTAAYAAKYCSELTPLTADVTPQAAAPPAPPVFERQVTRTNPYAIASLVLGLLWVLWLGSAAAVVFGHIALRQIKASGGRESGSGLAIAGLVFGYGSLVLLVLALILGDT